MQPLIKRKGTPPHLPAGATMDQIAQWYLDQALEFEHSKTMDANRSKVLAWRITTAAISLAGIALVASAVLQFYNKPNPPAVLQVHENGEVTVLKTLADAKITYSQATDIAYLRRYVNYRESYDWETIQDLYNATILLSSPKEAALYTQLNSESNRQSPVNVLKDRFRVIATAGTVNFVGKTALVSFTKKTVPLNGQAPVIDYFTATIAFEYRDQPMKDMDRGINVAGFRVTSYRVDRDITKATAVSQSAAAGAGS